MRTKIYKKILLRIILPIYLGLTSVCMANDLTVEGNISYQIEFDTLKLNIAKINNFGIAPFSPLIELQAKNNGVTVEVLHTYLADPIPAGESIENISRLDDAFISPTPGSYDVALVIKDQKSSETPVFTTTFNEPLVVEELGVAGAVKFEVDGNQLSIQIEKLRNNNATKSSVLLEVWAHSEVLSDPHILGSVDYGQLEKGVILNNISQPTEYLPPSPGLYTTSLNILDNSTVEPVILKSIAFSELLTISDTSAPSLDLSGSVGYTRERSTLILSASRLANNRDTSSGEIVLALVAQSKNEPVSDFEIGRISLGTIEPAGELLNISSQTNYTSPPPGVYELRLDLIDLATEITEVSVVFDDGFTVPTIEQFGELGFTISNNEITLNFAELWNNQIETPNFVGLLYTTNMESQETVLVSEISMNDIPPGISNDLIFTAPLLLTEGIYKFMLEIVSADTPDQIVFRHEFAGQINVPPTEVVPPLSVSGNIGFSVSKGKLNLVVNQLDNNDQNAHTPRLTLIATQNGNSHPIAEFTLESLPGGASVKNLALQGDYAAPPPGIYDVSLHLADVIDPTTIIDSIDFSEQIDIPVGTVAMSGPINFSSTDNIIGISVSEINNTTQNPVDLLLKLVATGTTNTQQTLLGEVALDRLNADSTIKNIEFRNFTPPQVAGAYTVTLELVDQSNDNALQLVTFDQHLVIAEPLPPPEDKPALEIIGNVRFNISDGNVTIQIGGIANNDAVTRTPLLKLIATNNNESVVIAEFELTELNASTLGENLTENANYILPPPGNYKITLSIADTSVPDVTLDTLSFPNELIVPEGAITTSAPPDLGNTPQNDDQPSDDNKEIQNDTTDQPISEQAGLTSTDDNENGNGGTGAIGFSLFGFLLLILVRIYSTRKSLAD